MSKDLLVLADEYAAATATFARALALKDEADSMSPIAREAGDKRAVLAEALAALDTAQPVQVNAMQINDRAIEIFRALCGQASPDIEDSLRLTVAQVLKEYAQQLAKQAQPERAPLTDAEISKLVMPYGFSSIQGFDHIKAYTRRVEAYIKQGGQHD